MEKVIRKCPICNNNSYKELFKDYNRREGWKELESTLVQCKKCKMKYLRDIPNFNNFAGCYQKIYKSNIFSKREKIEYGFFWKIYGLITGGYYRRMMDRPTFKGKKILDIGCNYGYQLTEYELREGDCYGIDLNQNAIEDAKINLPNSKFKVSTIEDSNFKDNYFDFIYTSHVFEHVYNPRGFLKKVHKILRNEGEFLIQVPNGDGFNFNLFKKYSINSWVPFHINLFGPKTISKLLKESGFKIISIKTLPVPGYWTSSLKQMGLSNKIILHVLGILSIPLSIFLYVFGKGEELYVLCKK